MHFFRFAFFTLLILFFAVSSTRAQSTFTYLDDEAEAGGFDITAQLQKLPVEWSLAEQENGDGYRLRISPTGVEMSTLQNKKAVVLASEKATITPGAIVLQRRGVRWKIVAGNRIVLQAEDDKWPEGKVGYRGGEVKDARLQPVEEIVFDDDFMRVAKDVALSDAKANPQRGVKINETKAEETIWRVVSGAWTTTGINENEQAMVAQSANPFAFQSKAKGENLTLSGRPFWSDYRVEAAVKPQNAQSVGLAVYASDAQNYLLFEWQQSGKLQLREIIGGQARAVLAEAATTPYDDKNWYRLSVAVSGSTLRAFIDEFEVLRARSDLFGRGPVGLFTRNAEADSEKIKGAVFDDLRVRSIEDFYETFGEQVAGRWQPVVGKWKLTGAAMPTDEVGAFTVMGEAHWNNYATSADITLPADAVAGLVAHHIKGEGAYVFRIAGSKSSLPYAGKAQIVKIGGGKSTPLAEIEVGNRFDNTEARWSFSSERGYLQGTIEHDEKPLRILDAFDESLSGGRAGLYAQRGGKGIPQLKNFAIEFPREKSVWAKVPDLMSTEREAQTMGGWSTPEGLWLPVAPVGESTTAAANDKTFWHKGAFWGDGDVRVKLPDLKSDQSLTLLFGSAARGASSRTTIPPLQLVLKFEAGSLKANLSRGEEKLGEGELKIEGAIEGKPLEVSRRGRFLILRAGPQDEQSTLLMAKVG